MNDELIRNIADFTNQCVNNIINTQKSFNCNTYRIINDKKFTIDIHPELHTKYFDPIADAIKKEFKNYVDNAYLSNSGGKYDYYFTIILKDYKQIRIEKIKEILKEYD